MTGDEGEGEKGLDVEMMGDCQVYFDGEDGPVGGGGGVHCWWGMWLSVRVKTYICTYSNLRGRSDDGETD